MLKFWQLNFKNFYLTIDLAFSNSIMLIFLLNIWSVQVRCFLSHFWLCLNSFWAVFCLFFEAENEKFSNFVLDKCLLASKRQILFPWAREQLKMTKMWVLRSLQQCLRMKLGLKRSLEKNFGRNFEYFDARKSDYWMEKVSLPENTLLYNHIWQSRKNKKIFYCNFL